MASADMSGKIRERMYVERPGGTRLARSRASDEGNRGLVFNDDNALVGQVELFPDGPGSRIKDLAAGAALAVAVCLAATKAAPVVKSTLSGLTSKLNRSRPRDTAPEVAPAPAARITLERADIPPAPGD
ncbi:hypothetical protein [Streptomyces sp. NPDC001642]|uniref:hypothetical protein n=1 Tax=Streptomyces sp. NPDC001642 TaxID=3154392 RepID=UPI003334847B